jgi:hypothetical protein
MFRKKNKPRTWVDITEEEKPKVGEVYRVQDDAHKPNLLYFLEVGSPTMEGPGYRYKYFNEEFTVLNDDALSEPRHIDQSIIEGELVKVEDPILIAKISLLL